MTERPGPSSDFAASRQVIGIYLHQDFDLEFASEPDAVFAMVRIDPATRRLAVKELRDLLTAGLTEPELRDVMTNRVGCYFDPGYHGLDYRQYVKSLIDRLDPDADQKDNS